MKNVTEVEEIIKELEDTIELEYINDSIKLPEKLNQDFEIFLEYMENKND